MKDVRTWVEIDQSALRHNAEQFFTLIGPDTHLMAVIKSNAYGHGLVQVAEQLAELGSRKHELGRHAHSSKFLIPNSRLWFGVDSIVEALRLRREGITHPILVLGHTLPSRIGEAAAKNITLTVSNLDALAALAGHKKRPAFHLKIDTGMHRQGFLPSETKKLISVLKRTKLTPEGIYTHFASAKDPRDPQYTKMQITLFGDVVSACERAGFRGMWRHAAATGGTILFPESRFDMVRVGMGLYGYWPSAEVQNSKRKAHILLKPVMSWHTVVGEIKEIPSGSHIGYDETEIVRRRTKIAVLPIGYWHGYDRGLSGIGEVLIKGKRSKVLGRISMDMIVADITGIAGVKTGDEAVLIGRQKKEAIRADALASRIGTTAYELLTRINPLIRRVIV